MPIIKNTTIILFVFILLTFSWIGCNSTPKDPAKANRLQIDYYVRYLQPEKQLKVNINFTKIDSTGKSVPIKMEEVLFANDALNEKKMGAQYRYQLEQEMPFAKNYSLTYRFNQKRMDSLFIAMQAISDFTIKKGKVSKTAGTNLTFERPEQATKETLVLLFSDSNNKTATIKIGNHPQNAPIIILPEQVRHLTLGKGKVYLVKKEMIQRKSTSIELTGLTEYYSAVKDIEIIE